MLWTGHLSRLVGTNLAVSRQTLPLLSLALKIGHGGTEERQAVSSCRIESSRARVPVIACLHTPIPPRFQIGPLTRPLNPPCNVRVLKVYYITHPPSSLPPLSPSAPSRH